MSLKKEIILVGTFHFEQEPELIKDKASEIGDLVEYLSDYKPIKIALEWDRSKNDELNEEYKASNKDGVIDEVYRLGFKLARTMQHEEVYAVNWTGNLTEEDMINLHNSIQSSYPEIQKIMNSLSERSPGISSTTNLINSYTSLNNTGYLKDIENMYLSFVEVQNDKGEMIGLNVLKKWFERELMIFKNIIDNSVEQFNQRVLLIIGNDHLWMLKKLFEGNGWNVINPFETKMD
ncbi:DUF5694 domain-containing protein [Guptibacillus hwajinpoensis]|uniref:TraB family protein n=1 Tax=Guptibacillus hwajinpoensis TaxID=208199 RepID=A0A0J6FUE7_9BACL|nr:DUF5694 domain-containing protein [Alkalihalobacillus macyae]KMM37977.1 hypothetical protein AB986_01190 [Alkalihalobacillus macyae]